MAKVIRIGRFSDPVKREAEIDLVRAEGGEIFQGKDGSMYARLPDNAPIAMSAVIVNRTGGIPSGWTKVPTYAEEMAATIDGAISS